MSFGFRSTSKPTAMAGQVDRSLPLFARAYALDPAWRTLVPRLPASGLLPSDPQVLSRIEKASAPPPAR